MITFSIVIAVVMLDALLETSCRTYQCSYVVVSGRDFFHMNALVATTHTLYIFPVVGNYCAVLS